MAIVRGKEVFAQVFVAAGEDSLNRRIHNIEWHPAEGEPMIFEGSTLPHSVYMNTVKNSKGQNVMKVYEGKPRRRMEFSPTTLFLAVISFVGLCTYVIVAAIHAHRCFG